MENKDASIVSATTFAQGDVLDTNLACTPGFYKCIIRFDGGTTCCMPVFLSVAPSGAYCPVPGPVCNAIVSSVSVVESSTSHGTIEYTLAAPSGAIVQFIFTPPSMTPFCGLHVKNASLTAVTLTDVTICVSYDGLV